MFTSNGLICLSGVTMCRMFLSAMTVSSDRPTSRSDTVRGVFRIALTLGAAIEPCANADVQTPAEMLARDRDKLVRLRFRLGKCKAGRPPGALPDPECALRLEMPQNRRNVGTAEALAALGRCEIVTKAGLQLGDRRSEAHE